MAGFVLDSGDAKPKNVALAVDREGEDIALYAKTHLIGLMAEDQHYAPGEGPVVFEIDGVPTSAFICYDLRFPEIFREVAEDVSLMIVIASWPAVRDGHWQQLLPTRAIENQCYVVGVNRVGAGGGHEFAGHSVIIDPLGNTLQQGGEQEELIVAEIDPTEVQQLRKRLPFLHDRQTE